MLLIQEAFVGIPAQIMLALIPVLIGNQAACTALLHLLQPRQMGPRTCVRRARLSQNTLCVAASTDILRYARGPPKTLTFGLHKCWCAERWCHFRSRAMSSMEANAGIILDLHGSEYKQQPKSAGMLCFISCCKTGQVERAHLDFADISCGWHVDSTAMVKLPALQMKASLKLAFEKCCTHDVHDTCFPRGATVTINIPVKPSLCLDCLVEALCTDEAKMTGSVMQTSAKCNKDDSMDIMECYKSASQTRP